MRDSINKLIEGYQFFREEYFTKDSAIYNDLVKFGQSPKIMVIACSDSRVDPAIVLNCKPGDLFVVRNVANLIPPYQPDDHYHGTSAALEFAVNVLGVHNIIVFGHSQCGGIKSLIEQGVAPSYSFISKWMELARDAHEETNNNYPDAPIEEKIHQCTHYAIKNSLNNLKTFPWILDKVNNNELCLHGWYFDLTSGLIDAYRAETGEFGGL